MSTTQALGTFSVNPHECIALTPAEVQYSWKSVLEPKITAAVVHTCGELTAEDVYDNLMRNEMFAWVVYRGSKVDAVLVLQPIQMLHFRVCRIVVISGEGFEEWKHFEAFIEHWARGMNCQFVDGLGRAGWGKFAKQLGYDHQYSIYRKKIILGVH